MEEERKRKRKENVVGKKDGQKEGKLQRKRNEKKAK